MAAKPKLQRLVVDLSGPISPEDSFSSVPYMKGQNFLRYLEDLLGGPNAFDPFLRKYFTDFAYKSIVTDDFKASLIAFFTSTNSAELSQIDWDEWLYSEGMPTIIPKYDNSLAAAPLEHTRLWETGTVDEIQASPLLTQPLTSLQRIELLNQLIDKEKIVELGDEWIKLLETTYSLGVNFTKNCDLRVRFVRLCIKARLLDRIPEIFAFANSNFRMNYTRALYRDLGSWSEARSLAVENFLKVENQMMTVCSNQVRKDLGL